MFFAVRKVNGTPYLFKLEAKRHEKKGYPTNKPTYIGSLVKVEKAIDRWRIKNAKRS